MKPFEVLAMPATSPEESLCRLEERARRRRLVELADEGDIRVLEASARRRAEYRRSDGFAFKPKG